MGDKSKKMWVLLGVIVVVVIIIIVAVSQGNKSAGPVSENAPANQADNSANNANNNDQEAVPAETGEQASTTPESLALQEAVVVVPGANPVSKDDKVLTSSGEETRTDVGGESPLAPQQTLAVEKESLPESVIKMDASAEGGFAPDSFTVKAGTSITISVTNTDSARSVTLGFTDPSLSSVMLGAGPLETRAITFKVPSTAGEYAFMDGIPGHPGTGKMIVE